MHVGVDGCPDGWIAVWYDDHGYVGADLYGHVDQLWERHGGSADTILIDVPIGLREDSSEKRPCDDAARRKLGRPRGSSVFPPPVRAAVHAESYEDAKSIQEDRTDGSLGVQSWNIADRIAQLDTFLLGPEPGARGVIREAHPEVCFWALDDRRATRYSKTGQPAAAFWERIAILQRVDSAVVTHVRDAGTDLDADVGNDDVVDAFALALTASPKTGPVRSLPDDTPGSDRGDPKGLPMEMVYALRSDRSRGSVPR